MGNAIPCVSPSAVEEERIKKVSNSNGKDGLSLPPPPPSSSKKQSGNNNNKTQLLMDDKDLAEQAVAAAMLFRQHQKNGSLPFPRSTSVNATYHSQGSKKQGFSKSSSSRQRSLADPLFKPTQILNQDIKIEEVETKHIILVHGGGFGAWCWYKIMTLLQEIGLKVDAIDLTASGTHSSDPNSITSLSQYTKPLTDLFQNLIEGDNKVMLVGHDIGGACISHVMELFPSKIAKSVFISATMVSNGQSALHLLSQQTDSPSLMREAQVFLYANGKDNPPTAIDLNKAILRNLLFNQTSAKDIALASVSMRPIPIAPVVEKLCLSEKNYGSVRRFYIKTQEDCAIPISLQEAMIESNPPEQVFQLKGSDHAPFFSKPQALYRILLDILQIPPKQA